MATYLQGVTDFIPQYQPFTPDLNFYDTILKTKQNQYDTNWQQLNKIYSQYYYADLTREDNIQKKEELIKNIDFNLKRISATDLSLQKNVDQAVQVFTPFYEDKLLMKDMATTKNYVNRKGDAMALKNSLDPKMYKQFWNEGVRAMDYRMQEFKNASAEEAMKMSSPTYTPYVNVKKQAGEYAKSVGLSMESFKFSPDNKWIITTKNGEQLMVPLKKLFNSTLGDDPRVQDVYRTKAYVARNDYAYNNAAEFGGDIKQAEMKYLEDNYKTLKMQQQNQYKNLESTVNAYDNKITTIQKQIKKGKGSPTATKYLNSLIMNRDVLNKSLQRIQQENELFSNQSSTLNTTTGFQNPYEDINTLRAKVDGGRASNAMQADFGEAAEVYATTNFKQTIKENKYAVLNTQHRNRMSQIAQQGKNRMNAIKMKSFLDQSTKEREALVKSGKASYSLQTVQNADGTTSVRYKRDEYGIPQIEVDETYGKTKVVTDFDGNFSTKLSSDEQKAFVEERDKQNEGLLKSIYQQNLKNLMASNNQEELSDQITKATTINGQEYSFDEIQTMINNIDKGENSSKLFEITQNTKEFLVANADNPGLAGLDKSMYGNRAWSDLTIYQELDKDINSALEQSEDGLKDYLRGEGWSDKDITAAITGNRTAFESYNPSEDAERDQERAWYSSRGEEKYGNRYIRRKSGETDLYGEREGDLFGGIGNYQVPEWDMISGMIKRYQNEEADKDNGSYLQQETAISNLLPRLGMDPRSNAIAGEGATRIGVNMDDRSNPLYKKYAGILNDFNTFDWNGGQVTTSFTGNSADDLELNLDRNKQTRALLNEFEYWSHNIKPKAKFNVDVLPVAGEDAFKSSVRLQMPEEFLKHLKKTSTGANLLSEDDYVNLMQNGVVIANSSNAWNNPVSRNRGMDPWEMRIKQAPLSFQDVTGTGQVTYTYDNDMNKFKTELQYRVWDTDKHDWINMSMPSWYDSGVDWSGINADILSGFKVLNEQNTMQYNQVSKPQMTQEQILNVDFENSKLETVTP